MPDRFADRLLGARTIYTSVNPAIAVTALALREGKVIAVGQRAEIEPLRGPDTIVHDLGERTVLPGLIDAHIHLAQYAQSLDMVDCATDSLAECLNRIGAACKQAQAGRWIRGHGWDQNVWGRWPTAADLDRVAPANPVYLTARSLHAAVANSSGLARAGLTDASPDPAGARLGRSGDGALDGLLFEENAMRVVETAIPPIERDALARQLQRAQQTLWRLGITGVHDFDGVPCFSALQMLHAEGRLGLRVHKAIRSETLDAAIEAGLRSGFGDAWLWIGPLKLFSDGALGPRTAAMDAPYLDDPDNRGILRMDLEEVAEIGILAHQAGLSLAIHAIGDRANRVVLDAMEQVQAGTGPQPPLPDRIEHLQILNQADISRPASLGVAASMQPIHATSDRRMADAALGDRVATSYAWRSILDSGALLAFGSDAPVEDPNPFLGIHAAVVRSSPGDDPAPPWVPEQRLSLPEALAAYTTGPARLAGRPHRGGRLAAGCYADLIVLDADPFQTRSERLHALEPAATMVGGEWRYSSIEGC
jgi:predicted amidohydrolase YtcJ